MRHAIEGHCSARMSHAERPPSATSSSPVGVASERDDGSLLTDLDRGRRSARSDVEIPQAHSRLFARGRKPVPIRTERERADRSSCPRRRLRFVRPPSAATSHRAIVRSSLPVARREPSGLNAIDAMSASCALSISTSGRRSSSAKTLDGAVHVADVHASPRCTARDAGVARHRQLAGLATSWDDDERTDRQRRHPRSSGPRRRRVRQSSATTVRPGKVSIVRTLLGRCSVPVRICPFACAGGPSGLIRCEGRDHVTARAIGTVVTRRGVDAPDVRRRRMRWRIHPPRRRPARRSTAGQLGT